MKKFTTIAILTAMLASLAACGESAGTSTQDSSMTEPVIETPAYDFGGAEYSILYRKEYANEMIAESENGDILNDAIYRRNQSVSEAYNVNLNFIECSGAWGDREATMSLIRGAVLAGDDAYDMIAGYGAYMPVLAVDGCFENVLNMEEINTTADYWAKQSNAALTINNKLYMISGDISTSFWHNMFVIYANKTLCDNFKVPDLYELTKSGKWTLAKLSEYAALCSADLDGNGTFSETDRFGFVTSTTTHMRAWTISLDTPITQNGSNGYPELCFVTEKSQDALEKLLTLHYDVSAYRANAVMNQPDNKNEPIMFTESRAMFMTGYLGSSALLRNMDSDYYILPYPKYDEKQDSYRTAIHDGMTVICFPKTAKDLTMSGVIADALCKESSETVIPAYYEVQLKKKIARDDSTSEMVDLIRDSVVCDFGWSFSWMLGNPAITYQTLITNNSTNLASEFAKNEPTYKANLENTLKAYQTLQ